MIGLRVIDHTLCELVFEITCMVTTHVIVVFRRGSICDSGVNVLLPPFRFSSNSLRWSNIVGQPMKYSLWFLFIGALFRPRMVLYCYDWSRDNSEGGALFNYLYLLRQSASSTIHRRHVNAKLYTHKYRAISLPLGRIGHYRRLHNSLRRAFAISVHSWMVGCHGDEWNYCLLQPLCS